MCWHQWTKWEPYEQQYQFVGTIMPARNAETFHGTRTRIRERRRCEKCGKSQDRVVVELFQ